LRRVVIPSAKKIEIAATRACFIDPENLPNPLKKGEEHYFIAYFSS
jgi:hypothetical protein